MSNRKSVGRQKTKMK